MNYKNLFYIPLLAIAFMSSCSNDNEINSTSSEYVNSVRVTVEDFQPESTTRTAYTVDASGFHFQWAEGDALGIYPVGGDQVKFPISKGDGSASASFDGGAWKLRSEYQYAAYYPFSADNYTVSESALPVNYVGQKQDGNGSTTHLGAYDYLACAATSPDANCGVDLTMKHLGAFVRFQLTMPKADTFSSVVLESDGAEFVTSGTFDLTAASPAITPTATSSTYTINLTNITTTEKNQMITVYVMVAPANLSTSNVKVTVHGTGKTTYVQTIQGKNFAARSAYNIVVDNFPSGTNASGENVNWEDEGATFKDVTIDGVTYHVGVSGAIDLGSSFTQYWAAYNVGASKPEEYGDYFAWGETIGYNEGKRNFAFSTYKWEAEGQTTWKYVTKYTDQDGQKDCYWYNSDGQYIGTSINGETFKWKTLLDLEDDVAHVKWHGDWHMPTRLQLKSLINNCTWTLVSYNGVRGYMVTGNNNNSIFLPTAGEIMGERFVMEGYCCYWSKVLSNGYSERAGQLVYPAYKDVVAEYRCYGASVRPVCDK